MARLGARFAGGVGTMADSQTNGPSAANAKTGMGRWLDFSQSKTWAWLYFWIALAYLLMLYFGHGGTRGNVV